MDDRETPLFEVKAELFKALAHPARIRALEVLATGERSVSDLQPDVGIESAYLSQQLGILRRADLVTTDGRGPRSSTRSRIPAWSSCSPSPGRC